MLLVWAGSAWLLGLILASITPLKLWQWFALIVCAAFAAVIFRKDRLFCSLFMPLCFLFLGAARWDSTLPDVDQEHVAYYADTAFEVQITGRIITDPDIRDNQTLLKLEVERIWVPALGIQKTNCRLDSHRHFTNEDVSLWRAVESNRVVNNSSCGGRFLLPGLPSQAGDPGLDARFYYQIPRHG